MFAALALSDHPPPETFREAFDRIAQTSEFWREWLGGGRFPDHPWREHLQRSALTLKGLIFAPTGAMLAASTTSLPETPHGERNWDYRYAWIRDSTFGLWGLYTLGFDSEANDFFHFVADAAEGAEDLQVMYTVEGGRELPEQILDHLGGYDGARPVRIGNGAYRQRQHDVWGALLDSVYLHVRSREYLPERVWPTLCRQVETALTRWREPDRGIWEVRGDPKHFTSSKVFCWIAADRGARLAALHDELELAERWAAGAQEIHADICKRGVDDRGVFVQHYGTTALDASLLLMPLVRFLPADDPRIVATVNAIADELTVDGLVLRYRVDETDDGLSGEEGTFTICSFWLVSALVEIGEVDRACKLCEKLLALGSSLQLYAEQIDAATGRHLGNFPQAFTHLALINAVVHVVRATGARGPVHARTGARSAMTVSESVQPEVPADSAASAESAVAAVPVTNAGARAAHFPPIADLAFLSDGEVAALVAPTGNVEWLCLPGLRLAERLRDAARPRRGAISGRPLGDGGSDRPALRPRVMVTETTWMTSSGPAHGARRADARAVARRDAHGRAAPPAGRHAGRARACCARSSACTGRSRSSSIASRCSTTAAFRLRGATTLPGTTPRARVPPTRR